MKTFEELGVIAPIRAAIEELGFVEPMPVQEAVIPFLIEGQRDVIALAQTGTGKTAAFGIPLLQRIDTTSRDTQALVLSPTRELCLQITDDLRDFSKHIEGIHHRNRNHMMNNRLINFEQKLFFDQFVLKQYKFCHS